jgi:hypothetical protein
MHQGYRQISDRAFGMWAGKPLVLQAKHQGCPGRQIWPARMFRSDQIRQIRHQGCKKKGSMDKGR